MLVNACPKPSRLSEADRLIAKMGKSRAAQSRWRQKAIERNRVKRDAMTWQERREKSAWKAKVGATKQRRMKEYRSHLASAYWKKLRQAAYKRDGGLCWCPECVQGRRDGVADAFEPIDIWLDTKGGIHGFHTHHLPSGYARFGKELLEDVLTMRPGCHMRLEAKMGYRQRFLGGKK